MAQNKPGGACSPEAGSAPEPPDEFASGEGDGFRAAHELSERTEHAASGQEGPSNYSVVFLEFSSRCCCGNVTVWQFENCSSVCGKQVTPPR